MHARTKNYWNPEINWQSLRFAIYRVYAFRRIDASDFSSRNSNPENQKWKEWSIHYILVNWRSLRPLTRRFDPSSSVQSESTEVHICLFIRGGKVTTPGNECASVLKTCVLGRPKTGKNGNPKKSLFRSGKIRPNSQMVPMSNSLAQE